MPRGDRTGPVGAGPMSGRQAGFCAGYNMPGYMNAGFSWHRSGYGFRGGGRGWRHQFYATGLPSWQRFDYRPPTPQEETEALKAESNWLKDQLDAINRRIDELEQK